MISALPRGPVFNLAGGVVHSSHNMRYHESQGVWFCGRCGSIGSALLSKKLAGACLTPTSTGKDYLRRLERETCRLRCSA
eukprot:3539399-Pyramimonas_sp.AAC.1